MELHLFFKVISSTEPTQ